MLKKILISILSLHFLFNFSFSQDDFSDESSENNQQVLTLSGIVIDASQERLLLVLMLLLMILILELQQMKMENLQLKVCSLVQVLLHQQLDMMI